MDPQIQKLPSAVLKHILTFADGEYATSNHLHRPQLPKQLFATLRDAGGAWKPAIEELQREFAASVVTIQLRRDQFETTDQANTVSDWLVSQLQHCGARVQCLELRLEMMELRRCFDVIPARVFAESFDRIAIDWTQFFALCPKLQRLDLSLLPLRSPHLQRILEAASTLCMEIKSLILPAKEWYRGPISIDSQLFFQTLYEAMDRWHHTTHGGLRQLTLPQRISYLDNATSLQASADEFIYAVATCCPQIEYLDGWKSSLRESEGTIRCDERIDCSPEVWELFCRSCTKLRELNWYVFPFVDVYFEIFALYPKPQLDTLTLVSNTCNGEAGITLDQRGSGCRAESVHHALTACPALQELTIIVQEDVVEEAILPTENFINDALLTTIAGSCPALTHLEIRPVDMNGNGESLSAQDPEGGITDEGCAALATLPHLRSFRLTVGSHVSTNGIFTLLVNAPLVGAARHVDTLIGFDDLPLLAQRRDALWARASSSSSVIRTGPSMSFHNALLELLQRMAVDHALLIGRRFCLEIHNGSRLYIDDNGLWQQQLEDAAARLEAACLQLSLHIVRQGGILTVTLSQSGCRARTRMFTGVHATNSSKRRAQTGEGVLWKTLAWCATINALAITAAVKVCTARIT